MNPLISLMIFLIGFTVTIIYKNYPRNTHVVRSALHIKKAHSNDWDLYSIRFHSIESTRQHFLDEILKERLVISFFNEGREGIVVRTSKLTKLTLDTITYYFLSFISFLKSGDFRSTVMSIMTTTFGNFTPESAIDMQHYVGYKKLIRILTTSGRMAVKAKEAENHMTEKLTSVSDDEVSEYERGLCDNTLLYQRLITSTNVLQIDDDEKLIRNASMNETFEEILISSPLAEHAPGNNTEHVNVTEVFSKPCKESYLKGDMLILIAATHLISLFLIFVFVCYLLNQYVSLPFTGSANCPWCGGPFNFRLIV